jgi:hypothetical protein
MLGKLTSLIVGTIRKVLSPITLSDGTVLPEGAILGIDTHEAVFNQSRLERPEVFDGMRYFIL